MSELIMNVAERRIDVYQDNYGDWRWVAMEAGQAVERSGGFFDSQEDALADASEISAGAPIVSDGVSADLDKLPPPPKINTLLEAQRGGYEAQKALTPEQESIAEETREKLRNMQKTADEKVAADSAERDAALAALPERAPDEGMGLDGAPPEQPPTRVRARGKKDSAPIDAPSDPLAKQVANRVDPDAG